MHPFLRTTNLPEGINNLIETLRRNAGGHFHSEREAQVKMKLLIDQLHQTRWKQQLRRLAPSLQELAQLFRKRFEEELSD
jgi:transposase-like protein